MPPKNWTYLLAAFLLPALLSYAFLWALGRRLQAELPSEARYRLAWWGNAAAQDQARPLLWALDLHPRLDLDTSLSAEPQAEVLLRSGQYEALIWAEPDFATKLEAKGAGGLRLSYAPQAKAELKQLLDKQLRDYEQRIVQERLAEAGLPPEFISPLQIERQDLTEAKGKDLAQLSVLDFRRRLLGSYLGFWGLVFALWGTAKAWHLAGAEPPKPLWWLGRLAWLWGAWLSSLLGLYILLFYWPHAPILRSLLDLLRAECSSAKIALWAFYALWPLGLGLALRGLRLGRRYPKLWAAMLLVAWALGTVLPDTYLRFIVPGWQWVLP